MGSYVLLKSCLKQCILKNMLFDKLGSCQTIPLFIPLFNSTHIPYHNYHNTPILFKKRKTSEDKQRVQKLRELALLNPKPKQSLKIINVWKNMTVSEFAASSEQSVDNILDVLYIIDKENLYDANYIFEDRNLMYEIAKKLHIKTKLINRPSINKKTDEVCDVRKRPPPDPSKLVKRHPIITIMGHVDHGKTTLLDSLRNTSVVDSEFGGITQHIGAFNVTLKDGEKMTFLDTPGHAAFAAMRSRGAYATDIVILVVAADDGVMEQTVQSINMAKNANVPIIVAINKTDKPNININRTQHMLVKHGITVEALGGDIQSINISALKGTNLDRLMEAVIAQAEIMNLCGDPSGLVEGVVIESSNDIHRGKLATALIQRGTLRKGDILVCGLAWAKVRAMFDHSGSIVSEAGLSDAVQIIGWRELPLAGDEILEVERESEANSIIKYRQSEFAKTKSIEQKEVADEKHKQHLIEYEKNVAKKRALGVRRLRPEGPREKENKVDDFPKVNIIIKSDVLGSAEALLDVIDTYDDEKKCRLSVVHYGVGPVTDTDVNLAKIFNAILYCFNTTVPPQLSQIIKNEKISIRYHNVIYKLIDDLKFEITKQLPLVPKEENIGEANILQEFEISEKRKKVKVAGCRCIKGSLKKSALFKVLRGDEVIYRGKASSIRHLKEEVDSIKTNMECGIKLENADIEFKNNDKVHCYKIVQKQEETSWNPGF